MIGWFCIGAAGGLTIFAVETGLIVQSGSALVAWDQTGVAQAAIAAAEPALKNLLTRIAIAYAVAGGALGLFTALLASGAAPRRFVLLWIVDGIAVCTLLTLRACIERPALFGDGDLVRFVMRHGAPWQPALALTALLAAHLWRAPHRPRALIAGAGIACVAWAPPSWPHRQTDSRAPLVVLIGLDAFRPDHLARHVAPNLERLLEDSVAFDNAWTPIAQTEPAWAALLSAAWPWRTGVRHPLTAEAQRAPLPTFAAAFARAGFHTTFATDCSRFNWQGPDSGFEVRLEPPRGAENFVLEKLRYLGAGIIAANALGSFWLPEIADNRALAGDYDPIGYAERLAERLDDPAPSLFAFHGTAAHYPGDVVYPFYRRSPDAPLRMSYELPGTAAAVSADASRREELYDELLSEDDVQVGILLDRLRAQGRYEGAWIVVFSDHGEGFHPDFPAVSPAIPVHGAQLSEEENRILLIVKPPRASGLAAGRVAHDLVRLIDIGPTLLDALGLPPLPNADGVSLLPALRGEKMPPLWLYAETGYTHVPPAAFDPAHYSGGPRGLDAYRILDDGAVEMTDRAHAIALREKDLCAYDGLGWLVQWRRTDGSLATRCTGRCSPELAAWLERQRPRRPQGRPARRD